jgi:hypothetical protein
MLNCHILFGRSITPLDEIRGEIWRSPLTAGSPLLGVAFSMFLIFLKFPASSPRLPRIRVDADLVENDLSCPSYPFCETDPVLKRPNQIDKKIMGG